jgi:hypothetical protein
MPGLAAAQTQPDERPAAREFAYAAYRLRVRIKAAEPAMKQATAGLDPQTCKSAISDAIPKEAGPGLSLWITERNLGIRLQPVAAAFGDFVRELDRVPTADPALVDGRNAWRYDAEFFAQLGPPPANACEQLRDWRLAGFPADGIPAAQPPAVHQAFLALGDAALIGIDRPEPRRAARRLQALGVPAGQARRFTLERLFDGVLD